MYALFITSQFFQQIQLENRTEALFCEEINKLKCVCYGDKWVFDVCWQYVRSHRGIHEEGSGDVVSAVCLHRDRYIEDTQKKKVQEV